MSVAHNLRFWTIPAKDVYKRQHLTIVVTALAVAHNIQERTGLAIAKVIKQLRPLRSATIAINGTTETFPPEIPEPQRQVLTSLNIPEPGH